MLAACHAPECPASSPVKSSRPVSGSRGWWSVFRLVDRGEASHGDVGDQGTQFEGGFDGTGMSSSDAVSIGGGMPGDLGDVLVPAERCSVLLDLHETVQVATIAVAILGGHGPDVLSSLCPDESVGSPLAQFGFHGFDGLGADVGHRFKVVQGLAEDLELLVGMSGLALAGFEEVGDVNVEVLSVEVVVDFVGFHCLAPELPGGIAGEDTQRPFDHRV